MTASEKRQALDALARLLEEAPSFGEIGLVVHFYNSAIDRMEERRSVSVKTLQRDSRD